MAFAHTLNRSPDGCSAGDAVQGHAGSDLAAGPPGDRELELGQAVPDLVWPGAEPDLCLTLSVVSAPVANNDSVIHQPRFHDRASAAPMQAPDLEDILKVRGKLVLHRERYVVRGVVGEASCLQHRSVEHALAANLQASTRQRGADIVDELRVCHHLLHPEPFFRSRQEDDGFDTDKGQLPTR